MAKKDISNTVAAWLGMTVDEVRGVGKFLSKAGYILSDACEDSEEIPKVKADVVETSKEPGTEPKKRGRKPKNADVVESTATAKVPAEVGEYEGKTAKELYLMCKDQGIEVEQKQTADHYIEALTKAKEIEETSSDYSAMSAKDLYKLCKEKGLEPETKQPHQYYIDLLTAEKSDDEWSEDDDEDGETAEDDEWEI